jgi:hypothetical protein
VSRVAVVARSFARRASSAIAAVWGAIVGLLPHVLHHVGPLAGAALLSGAAGTALFGAIGLAASVPFLVRLHRRFGTWRAPAIALALFAAMFSLSSFVIGPAISARDGPPPTAPARDDPRPPAPEPPGHDQHHGKAPASERGPAKTGE